MTVESIRLHDASTQVYNLTVENVHTFFVGDQPVLVHNASCGNLLFKSLTAAFREAKRLLGIARTEQPCPDGCSAAR
jgi:hypothetical protein